MSRRSTRPREKLAYDDPRFMDSLAARPLRIMAEYIDPLDRLRRANVSDTIVMFGSARIQARDRALVHGPRYPSIAQDRHGVARLTLDARGAEDRHDRVGALALRQMGVAPDINDVVTGGVMAMAVRGGRLRSGQLVGARALRFGVLLLLARLAAE